ncbi:MAG: hypothetical protein JNM36_01450 [Chitinophagales bacterium]|jgi:acyl carrier protein|nr:hypothetical protein [Chitinophagales bacterium]HNI43363.1 hypothetical protein [Chitinophagales bacterium]HNL06148.1 hypothetical protein [Chitinophagales bacterium]
MITDSVEEFVQKVEAEFDDLEPGTLLPDTNYRELEDWSSMHALVVIAFIDIEYGVTVKGEDLRSTETMRDIYHIVQSKSN